MVSEYTDFTNKTIQNKTKTDNITQERQKPILNNSKTAKDVWNKGCARALAIHPGLILIIEVPLLTSQFKIIPNCFFLSFL